MGTNAAGRRRVAGAAVAALLLCVGCGASSAAPATSAAQPVDPRSLILLPADLPGPYTVGDQGPGGGFEGVAPDLADAYESIGTTPWFYAASYGPLVAGRKPSSLQTAVAVLPSVSAARRIYRHARSLARYFGFYGNPNAMAAVEIGDEGVAFWMTGLAGGQPARARVIVWRSANAIGLVGVVAGAKGLAAELAQRQQRRILRATGGRSIAVPGRGAGIDRSAACARDPDLPATDARDGEWRTGHDRSLRHLDARATRRGRPDHHRPGKPRRQPSVQRRAGCGGATLSCACTCASTSPPTRSPGRELKLVGAIDGRVSVSTRLRAALDPRTGKLHIAGDDVSETTRRRIEFTSKQIVPDGSLSAGPHLLELRLAPAPDEPLRALRAVILPDSAIVVVARSVSGSHRRAPP